MEPTQTVSGLYYRYGKTTDDDIRELLKKIKIVVPQNKGIGSIHGYYPLDEEAMKKIIEKPRKVSLTFDAITTADKPVLDLQEMKRITYLVKSTSRFFLKPDIGEILDQIHHQDLRKVKAIVFTTDNETLPDTDGEHFLMTATLLE